MRPTDRWRLLLGTYARTRLEHSCDDPRCLFERRERALDELYGREYAGRGARPSGDGEVGPGGVEESSPHVVEWLGEIRELFPQQTVERIETHALDRYGLTELVRDPEVLARLEPNEQLLRTLLTLRSHLDPQVLDAVRAVIARVVEDLRRRLEQDVRRALSGRLSQHRHSPVPVSSAFDARGTVRANLAHYDLERQRIVVERPLFFERNTRRLPWEIVLCVDQSASMVGSVIHSAVMAGILAGIPAYSLRLVVFDTSVVDLTDRVDDPVELLLGVQLGGGTDIAQAVTYCEQVIDNPHRAVLVLVTDFAEGGPPGQLVGAVRRLAESGVRMVGLAALDGTAHPAYDRAMAARLADQGMRIAALTPAELAEWLAEVTAR